MNRIDWQIILGLFLIILSILFYLLHYAIFRDAHHIFIYLVGDVAFVFIEVLLVTLIIHRLLSEREKRSRLEKLNMVIGVFFSEIGNRLMTSIPLLDYKLEEIRNDLIVADGWTDKEFDMVSKRLKKYDYNVDVKPVNLELLRGIFKEKLDFLIRLLENPVLLEHESFTDLLLAVFHLSEELGAREDYGELPEADCKHLIIDIERVYRLLTHQWLDYMRHLKDNYPYLFSLGMRTNPFDQKATAIVR